MRIAVALSRSWQGVEVDLLTGALGTAHRGETPAEHAALEHALRLAELTGGSVHAITAGPPETERGLRDALAAGADRATRVDLDAPLNSLAHNGSAAGCLARALPEIDLVLCGDRSGDGGTGATPAFLAAHLDAAQALGVVHVELDGGRVLVHRRLDGGGREVLRMPRPAVVSVEGGLRLRRAALPAVLAAQEAEITVVPGSRPDTDVDVISTRPRTPRARAYPPPSGDTAHHRVLELTGALVDRTPPTVVGPLDPAEAADELLGYLRRHGYRG
ncbi:mycofactocin-associated electron transfer flavoprotein beta subunit [Saccharopolyspora sp. TS4A08]|uniref:Mycofactocin-associated electron transfer flavoprotein beta subunit n=1 Tax=Saccharopolyspora ipomoeae TaxID=3042027 RepID=A0ABT6PGY3_9PSEU|nr:mycofactocin-associated electron transfer flavoprotein beta subunit [Saccharopolyspora sp. TS4A08]MDI2027224.1 mycofactocin-associated electron transfer flavoprotein beta subunit [Saccharopolyspora sp. TS4A08]